jgi:CubicO group peptidase (beta-lactamase class C family)
VNSYDPPRHSISYSTDPLRGYGSTAADSYQKRGSRGFGECRRSGAFSGEGQVVRPKLGAALTAFGLGFAVRPSGGISGVPGSAGEFMWAGYAGTYFWVDPKEELTAIYMSQAPSPIRAYYRKLDLGSRIATPLVLASSCSAPQATRSGTS